jgi:hypothetical protein
MKTTNQIKSVAIDKVLGLLYVVKDKSDNVIKAIEVLENEQLDLLLLDLPK